MIAAYDLADRVARSDISVEMLNLVALVISGGDAQRGGETAQTQDPFQFVPAHAQNGRQNLLEVICMKISLKLTLFLAGVVVLFVGLADALIGQTRALVASYDELLKTSVKQADLARVTQVDFKKQVQEWKDILLRGHNPEDLAKYSKQFREAEAKVSANSVALSKQLQDPAAIQLLAEFVVRHDALGKKYQEAYHTYVGGGFDFKAADKIVRGMDRQPTNLFDQVVARLAAQAEQSVKAQREVAAHKQILALAIAGGYLLLLTVAGLLVVHNVTSRLGCLKLISDKLAQGEIAGLAIDIGGNDEVGEFGQSLKGVHAAIEELATAKRGHSATLS
jgi:methyl-accepting chemotaxis protein